MRIWFVVVLALTGCEGKKHVATTGSGVGSQVVVAVPADATAVAVVAVDAAPLADAALDGRVLSDPKTLDYEHIFDWEMIGPLKLGMDEAKVIKLLGAPKKKSFPIEEGATGEYVSDWEWPGQGLVVGMAAEMRTAKFHVRSIEVFAPSTLMTTRGVVVGMALEDVPARYQRNIDEGRDDPNEYLVGSVYGGMLFTLKDRKVVSIFLGAMAF
jgi:hypothetical protein